MDDLNQLLHFSKLHGLGNDYIFLDAITQDLSRLSFPAVAQLLSDRHFGIGSDGLILACRPADSSANILMRMFNSDGSEGEMCGNGLRCLVKFVIDRALVSQNPLMVETGAGTLQVAWERTDGKVSTARVDMGRPRLTMREIPAVVPGVLSSEDRVIHYTNIFFEGLKKSELLKGITLVSMGNPHAIFVTDGKLQDIELEKVGPVIERDPMFPARINVHFVKFNDVGDSCDVRTWERGSGITLACGTGASAVCVAGVLLGIGQRKLRANLPGGPLDLEWASDDSSVFMTGPATHVFDGTVKLNNPKYFLP